MGAESRMACAGRRDTGTRSDCFVEIELKTRGGIILALESKVVSLYGESIRTQVREVCTLFGVQHASITIVDQGALPFALGARLEAAIRRAMPAGIQPPALLEKPESQRISKKDRLRRTRLYLPGNEPKFFINAGLHRADMIILDLEDSVAPSEKDAARILVRNALRSVDFGGSEVAVRINVGQTGLEDLREIAPQRPDVVLIPKCEDADMVMKVDAEVRAIRKLHRTGKDIFLLPIIESALGVEHAFPIASASPRVCALAIGLEDYTADLGVERTAEGKESLYARMRVVNAAKAAEVQALDSVFSDVDDAEGLLASAREAKALGFEGKGCIHPRQIAVIHEGFAATPEEIDRARQIVAALQEARSKGSGVVALGSKMIDAPVVARAQRVLRLAGEAETKGGAR